METRVAEIADGVYRLSTRRGSRDRAASPVAVTANPRAALYPCTRPNGDNATMGLLWSILIVRLVVALLGFFSRGVW